LDLVSEGAAFKREYWECMRGVGWSYKHGTGLEDWTFIDPNGREYANWDLVVSAIAALIRARCVVEGVPLRSGWNVFVLSWKEKIISWLDARPGQLFSFAQIKEAHRLSPVNLLEQAARELEEDGERWIRVDRTNKRLPRYGSIHQ